MTVLCATDLRPVQAGGPDPLIRLAGNAGASGIHLGGGCFLDDVPHVATAALKAGQVVPTMALPMGERVLAPGKRLPALSAHDAEERGTAIKLVNEGLGAGAGVGVRWVLLDFGMVPLPVRRKDVTGAFVRRELGEGDDRRDLDVAIAVRKSRAEALGDACRWSLERLCRGAEALGVTLVLPVGSAPWDVPSAREALGLVAAFTGAPVSLLWDPGRLSAHRALGLPLPESRIAALAAAASVALETDAVGLRSGYLPGLGERDEALPARARLSRDAPVIVSGFPDSTDAEVARAIAVTTARYETA